MVIRFSNIAESSKGRILFNSRAYNAPNVRSVDVYWNNGLDSLIIPVI